LKASKALRQSSNKTSLRQPAGTLLRKGGGIPFNTKLMEIELALLVRASFKAN